MRSLIIARYQEATPWLKNVGPEVNIHLYNKGEEKRYPNRCFVEKLPNIGREAHTFLHHIVTHYNELRGQYTFVQGSPHYPNFVNYYNELERVRFTQIGKAWFRRNSFPWFRRYYEGLFNRPCPEQFTWLVGSQVVTTAGKIRRRPLSFWKQALAFAEENTYVHENILHFGMFHEWVIPFMYSGRPIHILERENEALCKMRLDDRLERAPFLYL